MQKKLFKTKNRLIMNDSVINIRTSLKTLPQDPVVYKWWFKEIPNLVLNHPKIETNRIEQREWGNTNYYALYVGIGVNCKQRFKWHIGQKHTSSAVNHGLLSTLRQTFSALLGVDMTQSESVVNSFMDDNCLIEWTLYPGYTKKDIESIETQTIQAGYYPLNIDKNKNVDKIWKKYLKSLRKNHKK